MRFLLILLVTIIAPFGLLAQAPPPGGGSGGGSSTGAPIDGASGILLASVAAYGYTKLRNNKEL